MAVPKRRQSHARTGKRRSAIHLSLPQLVLCASCGSHTLPHQACPSCGAYLGRPFLTKDKALRKKEPPTTKTQPVRPRPKDEHMPVSTPAPSAQKVQLPDRRPE